jgi:4'-phosphopantetheinyl transferase EntD
VIDAWERLAGLGVEVSVRAGLPAPVGLPGEDRRARRRREFAEGRTAARCALRRMGVEDTEIPQARTREPIWPDGVTGSITHCEGCCAAAVAPQDRVAAIGIDVEPHAPLPSEVVALIVRPDERDDLAGLGEACPGVCWDRLIFSSKEAAFKASFAFHRTWPEFDAVRATVRLDDRSFEVSGRGIAFRGSRSEVVTLSGHWSVEDGFIRTAVAISGADVAARGWRRVETPCPR